MGSLGWREGLVGVGFVAVLFVCVEGLSGCVMHRHFRLCSLVFGKIELRCGSFTELKNGDKHPFLYSIYYLHFCCLLLILFSLNKTVWQNLRISKSELNFTTWYYVTCTTVGACYLKDGFTPITLHPTGDYRQLARHVCAWRALSWAASLQGEVELVPINFSISMHTLQWGGTICRCHAALTLNINNDIFVIF